ncbi:hypothetical protein PENSPDRAFT_619246 [Peniophora sp. CONT]|nr:hypothetical protein PENSPDRAFT_619246 [Peniophora sp. CONT]
MRRIARGRSRPSTARATSRRTMFVFVDLVSHPKEAEARQQIPTVDRQLHHRRSIADDSGAEEIVYPRSLPVNAPPLPPPPGTPSRAPPTNPPAFLSPMRHAKKRSSDEFEHEHAALVKHSRSPSDTNRTPPKDKDIVASSRKHRSLGAAAVLSPPAATVSNREKGRERRRESASTSVLPPAAASKDRHARHPSAGSVSSPRAHGHSATGDFSHLPPSPSSSSIQHFLRHVNSAGQITSSPPGSAKDPAHVAHSLLRGTQESSSDLDAEALRRLDGLGGKRGSRASAASRPGTPARAKDRDSAQWEGVGSDKGSRRSSTHHDFSSGADEGGKRHAARLSTGFAPKRGSAGSTTYTSASGSVGTPTTTASSRDSASLSAATSVTSMSTGTPKRGAKRNSGGSDASGLEDDEHHGREQGVPPVPPLPKDLALRSPPPSSHSGQFDPYAAQVPRRLHGDPAASSLPPSASTDTAFSNISSEPAFSPNETEAEDDASPVAVGTDAYAVTTDVEEYTHALTTDAEYTSSSSQQITSHHPRRATSPPRRAASPPRRAASPPRRAVSPPHRTASPPTLQRRATTPPAASATISTRTPSKKWSFTGGFGKRPSQAHTTATSPAHSNGPVSSVSVGSKGSPLSAGGSASPRTATFPTQSRRSASRDRSTEPWGHPEAMGSAASLSSLASSNQHHHLPSRTPDRHLSVQSGSSRPPTAEAAGPMSPGGSVRRGASKRLTPSSIPFFRRSSSQSMAPPPPTSSSHGSTLEAHGNHRDRERDRTSPGIDSSISTPGPASKKSSMLSLGALLKGSSSRRNLADNSQTDYRSDRAERGTDRENVSGFGTGIGGRREREREREREKGKERERRAEGEGESSSRTPRKKDEKDPKERSESRISVLMRRRGKTVSSTDPKKAHPVSLPPMQMSALPPSTAQRLATLSKPGSQASLGSGSSTASTPSRSVSGQGSSRVTQPTASSLQRAAERQADAHSLARSSDTSLRSRNTTALPTIAGSPSVGTITKSGEPSAGTKIPRIHSRTSTVTSPALSKSTRRQSLLVASTTGTSSNEPSPTPASEFGVLDSQGASPTKGSASTLTASSRVRASPSSTSNGSAAARARPSGSGGGSGIPTSVRKNRESLSFGGLRKSSTSSVASVTASDASHAGGHSTAKEAHAHATPSHGHRFSALSPSKGLKLLSPKVRGSATPSRSSVSASTSTPSPAPTVDEEEAAGDEEMMQYIKRQQAKKLAHGATQAELDALLQFPEPTPPVTAMNPTSILKGSQRNQLSDYEQQEILEFTSAYFLGGSGKKPAHPDRPTNNFGYDDERGDYLVVNGDHLAYRYEVIDTLGKGSFGQVLSCRDHCTGQMVAIKIIRNKKRFHHQALVEIKILDNLRKWDAEEKHHVIKMTEHFYFRNHLCIAMELLSINLYELIKANGFVGFTTALIRRFTSQMLLSLVLMRHHRIVHCDLKPENVLLRHPAKSAIKVIDFGSSCLEHEKIYTYIQSRFYRSPEVILGMNYHMAIDMWSLGCILAELKTGFPIFPGENEQEQLACIMEVLGVPDKDFVARSSRKRLFFDSTGAPRPVVNSKGRRRRPGTKQLAQVLRTDDELFVDFIAKCLVWDPERRIKPQAALKHPFMLAGKHSSTIPQTPSRGLSTPSSKNTSSSSLVGSSRKSTAATETPKKSLISAPAPLSARRTASSNVTSTPGAGGSSTLSSSRSYRASGTAASSSGYHSSRTLNGFTVR